MPDDMLAAPHALQKIEHLIHVVRDRQVMLDADLARLYGVDTKRINESVKRNEARFPEGFCFRLTEKEAELLRSQNATSSTEPSWGGRRKPPRVFTEQGVAMLSATLRSKTAIEVSIAIMDAFVEMRHLLADRSLLLDRITQVELQQHEYQKETDKRFERIFGLFDLPAGDTQHIFFEGQVYDAFSLLADLVSHAREEIVLIDGYVDVATLNLLAKKHVGVTVRLYTRDRSGGITPADADAFNAQYPQLILHRTDAFHDRFLIFDGLEAYHIGASLKDAGKRCFCISPIQDAALVQSILERLD